MAPVPLWLFAAALGTPAPTGTLGTLGASSPKSCPACAAESAPTCHTCDNCVWDSGGRQCVPKAAPGGGTYTTQAMCFVVSDSVCPAGADEPGGDSMCVMTRAYHDAVRGALTATLGVGRGDVLVADGCRFKKNRCTYGACVVYVTAPVQQAARLAACAEEPALCYDVETAGLVPAAMPTPAPEGDADDAVPAWLAWALVLTLVVCVSALVAAIFVFGLRAGKPKMMALMDVEEVCPVELEGLHDTRCAAPLSSTTAGATPPARRGQQDAAIPSPPPPPPPADPPRRRASTWAPPRWQHSSPYAVVPPVQGTEDPLRNLSTPLSLSVSYPASASYPSQPDYAPCMIKTDDPLASPEVDPLAPVHPLPAATGRKAPIIYV
eukprot:TRINITY_DN608_c0_g2_i1.p1 TRINITY_DN608_c0_g2~~TRINITY_DN608_c0_g2_i1.p1  ORF type:complete len:379 (+),score=61.95 TRINITY_DN608_c0_g2_i1:26-1162(+)